MNNIPELFGTMVFNDDVMRRRLPKEVYRDLTKTIATGRTIDPAIADVVANAMKDWAIEKGATHYTHWFQPLTGVTAEKHDAFIAPIPGDRVVMEFSGKELIKGEPDASSFPSGGLRATFEARGYTAWDPASYAFVKDGTLYIPTTFISYTGEALDTKTPLLRSMDAVSEQALRILRLFGDTTTARVTTTVGAEQEYFLVNKDYYERRKDLIYCGRTLFGAPAPKGQEMDDHYFGPIKPKVAAFMDELDEELWKLGINAKTEHNEAAPAQHELAPIYATTNMAVDQNLLTMEYMRLVAERHGLVCLLHEKPYAGVNGSGKHNNWSLTTDSGKNLVDPGKTPGENTRFLLFLAAIIAAVDEYQDLLRLSVASPGNDHRLGGYEAPPAIISMFLGEELDDIINALVEGHAYADHKAGTMNLGIPSVPTFRKDTTDRNRTSPIAFTGNKFEFRSLGSSQNIAMPNIVINAAVAGKLCDMADRLEAAVAAGEDFSVAVAAVIREFFAAHRRIIFNGNGYAQEWTAEAARRGLSNLRTTVEACEVLSDPHNIELFTRFGILSPVEVHARQEILLENYAKVLNIEAQTMILIATRQIIPAVENYVAKLGKTARAKLDVLGSRAMGTDTVRMSASSADLLDALDGVTCLEREIIGRLSMLSITAWHAADQLRQADREALAAGSALEVARAFRDKVVPVMATLRATVDEMETLTAAEDWPLPTYGEMMHMQ
ncbi:MAG: glutamine synthetase III [Clostridia bacterium]|nr:glutamine synthetase III [Clostridia bacterium]